MALVQKTNQVIHLIHAHLQALGDDLPRLRTLPDQGGGPGVLDLAQYPRVPKG